MSESNADHDPPNELSFDFVDVSDYVVTTTDAVHVSDFSNQRRHRNREASNRGGATKDTEAMLFLAN